MSSDLEIGSQLAGYRIEAPVGRGGMGVVYRARDLRLDRTVGLKVLPPEYAADEDFRTRFERESRLAALIDHPNIIPVYEAGEAEGRLFIAMRWVEGSDLRGLLQREGPLSLDDAIAIIEQVGGALDAAHEQGLLHRDVKPANVLISSGRGPGGKPHAYLSDFGIAKLMESAAFTRTGLFLGTPDYAAPEQFEGKELDGRADVYALGCLLFNCLTGAQPFGTVEGVAAMYAHLHTPPPKLSEHRSGLPPILDDIVARAMAKSREERFATCADLVAAARAAAGAATRPTIADRPSPAATVAATSVEEPQGPPAADAPTTAAPTPPPAAPPPPSPPSPPPLPVPAAAPTTPAPTTPAPTPIPPPPAPPPPAADREARRKWTFFLVGLAVVVAAIVATVIAVVSGGASDEDAAETPTTATTAEGGTTEAPATEPPATEEEPPSEPAVPGSVLELAWVASAEEGLGGEGRQEIFRVATGAADGTFAVGAQGTAGERDPVFWQLGDSVEPTVLAEEGEQVVFGVVGVDEGAVAVGFTQSEPPSGDTDAAAWLLGADGWAPVDDLAEPGYEKMNRVTAGSDGELVAVGARGPGVGAGGTPLETDGSVWVSSEGGESWLVFAEGSFEDVPGYQELRGVVAYDDGFVSVGQDTKNVGVWRSDGDAWRQVSDPDLTASTGSPELDARDVAVFGDGLVAVGDFVTDGGDRNGAVWVSDDGEDWRQVDGDFGGDLDEQIYGVAAGEFGVVAVGCSACNTEEAVPVVWASTDGEVWERFEGDALPAVDGAQELNSVAVVGSTLVAAGWGRVGGEQDATVWTATLPASSG